MVSSPERQFNKVVLPQPLGPMIATISPALDDEIDAAQRTDLHPADAIGPLHPDRLDQRRPHNRWSDFFEHGLRDSHDARILEVGAPEPGSIVPISRSFGPPCRHAARLSDVDFAPGTWETDVILADGGSAHLRPVRPDDAPALQQLYESLSDESRYLRFFSPAPPALAGTIGPRVEINERHFGLVVESGDAIVGVADYYRTLDDVAEAAFTVRDDQQGRGLGTLLLDHLAEVAAARGIHYFVAQVLARNQPMRRVFRDAGFEVTWSRFEIGVVEVTLDLARTEHWLDAHAEREHTAEARSVARAAVAALASPWSERAVDPTRSVTPYCETCLPVASRGRCTR